MPIESMDIIQVTSGLSPEFGGPARTVPALSFALAERGHVVDLVHLEFGDQFQKPYLPAHPNLTYHPVKTEWSFGLRPLWVPSFRSRIQQIAEGKKHLIIHDNGIWLPHSRQNIRIANEKDAPLLTTVHGMLEPWAFNYGRLRKRVAWHLYQKRRLKQNDLLHATSLAEARNLKRLGLSVPIALIPNGTVIPEVDETQQRTDQGDQTILFLSRIHPKKGLLNLVEALRILDLSDWKVIIAGYDEGGYQRQVEQAAKSAGLGPIMNFIGPVDDIDKWRLYKEADLFVLPSFSENFGIVVIEALAMGTPVLTTKGTPWQDLVDYNCGWWVEPTVEGILEGLKDAVLMDDEQRKKMGSNGRSLVKTKYSWSSIASEFEKVYCWLLGRKEPAPASLLGSKAKVRIGDR